MSSTPVVLPTVRATILLDMPFALAQDINTLWLRALVSGGPVGTLATAVAATDTTFVLRAPLLQSLVGLSLLIDNEPVSVSAQSADNTTLTVVRYATAFPYISMLPTQPTSAHAVAAGLYQLNYVSPWNYMVEKYVRPAAQSDVISLGAASATFGTVASGSLGATPAPAA